MPAAPKAFSPQSVVKAALIDMFILTIDEMISCNMEHTLSEEITEIYHQTEALLRSTVF